MKPGSGKLAFLLGLCLWMGVVSPARPQVPRAAPGSQAAQLSRIRGRMLTVREALAGPLVNPVVRGMLLYAGNVVQTGISSLATLLFVDRRRVDLSVDTIAEISRTAPYDLKVHRGVIHEHVPHRLQTSVEGPSATAYVGGTDFIMAVADDGTTTVTVDTGQVSFTNNLGGVVVGEGQQSVARPGRAPTPPVAVNLPFIVQWAIEERPAVPALEPVFVSRDPARLQAAQQEAEALPAGAERWRRLGDVAHDRSELQQARQAYEAGLASLAPTAAARERALVETRLGQTLLEMRELPAAEAAFRRSLALEPGQTGARTGLVITLLNHGQYDPALAEARAAVAQDPSSPSAFTALALAQIERGEPAAAQQSLQKALALDASYAPASAWQSFLLRAAGRLDEADEIARHAVALAPGYPLAGAALAWQSLSDAAFALDRISEARQAAEQAVRLNPQSPGAFMSLARARLQEGDLDRAAQAGEEAVRLAPDVGRAHFFLGVALAEQRRLGSAAGALEEAVKLDPVDLEARSFLARVYIEQDKPENAIRVAREALSREKDFAPARAALGWVYWHAGKLPEAVKEYQAALKVAPESLLYHLELARVYLDRNDLPDALAEALEAVHEVPGSSEAHAILGLVYDRQENRDQAIREYQEALSLSPDNSLARLGLVTAFTPASFGFFGSGEEQLGERAQALLRDPAVLEQTFKPGVTSELSGTGGSDSDNVEQYLHRGQFWGGRVHDLSAASHFSDDSYRANAGYHGDNLQSDVPVQATPNTEILVQYLDQRLDGGLPGAVDAPDRDASARRRRTDYDLHARQYLGKRTHLWLGQRVRVVRDLENDADAQQATPFRSDGRRTERVPELRLDHTDGEHRLSYGVAQVRDDVRLFQDTSLLPAGTTAGGSRTADVQDQERDHLRDFLQYYQDDYRLGERGALIVGAQWLRTKDHILHQQYVPPDAIVTVTPQPPVALTQKHGDLLPYLEWTYSPDVRNLVRLLAHKTRVRFGGSLLAPSEAFLVEEPVNVSFDGLRETYEFDYERRFSARSFAKLFLQDSLARRLYIQPTLDQSFGSRALIIPRVEERIAGVRFEQQITGFLSGFTRLEYVDAEDHTSAAYNAMGQVIDSMPNHARGLQVPFSPRWRGLMGLNYVDRSGTKVRLEASFLSRQFTDVEGESSLTMSPFGRMNQFGGPDFVRGAKRPTLGPRTQVDLRIAREPSPRWEYGLTVSNLFNTGILDWPGYPRRGRLWLADLAWRF